MTDIPSPASDNAALRILTSVAVVGSAVVFLLAVAVFAHAALAGTVLPEDLQKAAVIAHLTTVLAALPLGLSQLVLPKGTPRHRIVGYVWCALMVLTSLVSFAVHQSNPGGLSPIHLFSVLTLAGVPVIISFARTGNLAGHQRAVLAQIIGGLVIAGLFTFVPGRAMGELLAALFH